MYILICVYNEHEPVLFYSSQSTVTDFIIFVPCTSREKEKIDKYNLIGFILNQSSITLCIIIHLVANLNCLLDKYKFTDKHIDIAVPNSSQTNDFHKNYKITSVLSLM